MKFRHFFSLESASPSTRVYQADGVRMRIDFLKDILRVALIRDDHLIPTWSVCPGDSSVPFEGRPKLSLEGFHLQTPEVFEDEDFIRFEHCGLNFTVERMNFRITVSNNKGTVYRDRSGLAYNFDGELGEGTVHFTQREEDQRIFGLGDKYGNVNKSGQSFELGATDSMGFKAEYSDPLYKHVPFYIHENSAGSYGIFYDTLSFGRVNFGKEHDNYYEPFNSVRYEEENTVFYLIFGSTPEIVRRFTKLCGGAAPVPEWAFRYCGSTMEYTDAENTEERLNGFLQQCEDEGIRAGGFYLSSGYTQIKDQRCVFHWNTDKIPSPAQLAKRFRDKGLRILPNVKPAFLTSHPMYGHIAENGWFLHYADGTPAVFPFWGGMASYLDFTHPGAYGFWKTCVKEKLADLGYRNIWNDNNEYDVWDKGVLAHGFGREIPANRIRPLFSLLMSMASREAVEDGTEIPFSVSRCAIPGTQRIATTWTGDNFTSFPELRWNHRQAMTMALSGFAFFGQDIGGFAGPKPSRELFLRWLQYGVFTPRFVLHSWKPGEPSTMPWLYPDRMAEVREIFALRERLVPYLKSSMDRCAETGDPLIRPVFLFDPEYDTEADWFLCGDKILACPVFDEGQDTVRVLLPGKDGSWKLRGEGEPLPSGTTMTVRCTVRDLPVWFERVE